MYDVIKSQLKYEYKLYNECVYYYYIKYKLFNNNQNTLITFDIPMIDSLVNNIMIIAVLESSGFGFWGLGAGGLKLPYTISRKHNF